MQSFYYGATPAYHRSKRSSSASCYRSCSRRCPSWKRRVRDRGRRISVAAPKVTPRVRGISISDTEEEEKRNFNVRTSRKKEQAGGKDEWDEGLEARFAAPKDYKRLNPGGESCTLRRDADRELQWFIDAVPLGILQCG